MQARNNIEKYLHIAINNATSRWKDISLYNLAKQMSVEEAQRTMEQLQPQMVQHRQARVDRLKALDAPDIIITSEIKLFELAKAGKSPWLANLQRRIKAG